MGRTFEIEAKLILFPPTRECYPVNYLLLMKSPDILVIIAQSLLGIVYTLLAAFCH